MKEAIAAAAATAATSAVKEHVVAAVPNEQPPVRPLPKPKSPPGMGTHWKVDEKELLSSAREQFALADRLMNYRVLAKRLGFATFGCLVGTLGAILLVGLSRVAAFVPAALFSATWLGISMRASLMERRKRALVNEACRDIQYVPEEEKE